MTSVTRLVAVAAATLAAVAAAQDRLELNTITKVQVSGGAITIVGTKKPNFTTFTMTDPARLVIDISEAVFSGVQDEQQVGNGVVTAIKTASYGSDASAIARVLIGFEKEYETDIQTADTKLVVKVLGAGASAGGQEVAMADKQPPAQPKADQAAADKAAAEQKKKDEEAAKQAAADEKKRKEEEAAAAAFTKKQEAEAAKQAAVDEKKRKQEEAAAAAEQKKQEELAAKNASAEEKKQKAEEAAAAREQKKQEELAAKQASAEEKKKAAEEAAGAREQQKQEALAAKQAAAEEKKRLAEEAAAERERKKQEAAEARQQQKVAMAETSSGQVESSSNLTVSNRRKNLTFVGFKQDPNAQRVYIRTNEPVRYSLSRGGDKQVVLELENTAIALHNNERFLDTSYFNGAVALVHPRTGPTRTVRVEIKLKENVPYEAKQEGNEVYVDFQSGGRR